MGSKVAVEVYGEASEISLYKLETIYLTSGRPAYRRVLEALRGERVLDFWALGSVSSLGSINRVRDRVGLAKVDVVSWRSLDELERALESHLMLTSGAPVFDGEDGVCC